MFEVAGNLKGERPDSNRRPPGPQPESGRNARSLPASLCCKRRGSRSRDWPRFAARVFGNCSERRRFRKPVRRNTCSIPGIRRGRGRVRWRFAMEFLRGGRFRPSSRRLLGRLRLPARHRQGTGYQSCLVRSSWGQADEPRPDSKATNRAHNGAFEAVRCRPIASAAALAFHAKGGARSTYADAAALRPRGACIARSPTRSHPTGSGHAVRMNGWPDCGWR